MTTWSRCASGERATGAFIKSSYSVLVGSVGEYPAARGFKSRARRSPYLRNLSLRPSQIRSGEPILDVGC